MKQAKVNFSKTITSLISLVAMTFILIGCSGGGGGGGGPTTPHVASKTPTGNTVPKNSVVTATFSGGFDDLATQIFNTDEFTLGDSAGNPVGGVVGFDSGLNKANFTPVVNLGVLKSYTAVIGAGGTITHSGGTALAQYNWSFTTVEGAWGTEENIEMDGTSDFSSPRVAVGGNGDGVAVWLDVTGGTRYIYYNKYSSSTPGWNSSQILEFYGYPIANLRVAMDHNGNAMALWSYDGPGASIDIYASYYNGATWGAAGAIETITGVASEPQIAFDASGNAIAVWLHDTSIYANRYSGSWTPGAAQEIDTGVEIAYKPQLAVFDNGDAIAVWAQYSAGDGYNVIYASHYDSTNDVWSAPPTSLGNSSTGSIPQVAVGDGGDAIVIWMEGGGNPASVFASVYDGANWSVSPVELDNDAHIDTTPQVGIDALGNGIALWKANPLTNNPARLRYKVYTAGSVWGAVGNVDNGVSDTTEPKLVMDDEGHAIVVWRQYTNDTTDMVYSTWANRYRSDTNDWGTPGRIESVDYETATGIVPAPITSLNLGMNKYNGTAFAIWLQDQDGATVNSVWVNHFTN